MTPTWRRRDSTWFAYPDDRAPAILGVGLSPTSLALDVAAWSESSRYRLSGLLDLPRARRLPGWTARRQDALIEAGFWRLVGDVIELVGYLGYNQPKDVIERSSAAKAAAAKKSADDRVRDSRGQFAEEEPEVQ